MKNSRIFKYLSILALVTLVMLSLAYAADDGGAKNSLPADDACSDRIEKALREYDLYEYEDSWRMPMDERMHMQDEMMDMHEQMDSMRMQMRDMRRIMDEMRRQNPPGHE